MLQLILIRLKFLGEKIKIFSKDIFLSLIYDPIWYTVTQKNTPVLLSYKIHDSNSRINTVPKNKGYFIKIQSFFKKIHQSCKTDWMMKHCFVINCLLYKRIKVNKGKLFLLPWRFYFHLFSS